jgi:hypothetical protein
MFFAEVPGPVFLTPIAQVSALPRYVVAGVTRDSSGAPLGGCVVEVFSNENPPRLVGATVSDPVSGEYSVDVPGPTAPLIVSDGEVPDTTLTFQAVAYLPGSPDVAGVTVNTLIGTPA